MGHLRVPLFHLSTMTKKLKFNKNLVVAHLHKMPQDFTLSDIIQFVEEKGIEMINFMYPAEDGRLKTLNFVINDLAYLETILTQGERVDGSSLFPSFVEPGNSDLYVVPRYRTAFVDPFSEIPTLCFLCSYFDKDGKPWDASPEYTLKKAVETFHSTTGLDFYAMGELEFYVVAPENPLFPATDQKGYHESSPFAKFNEFRTACMLTIAHIGGQIKYGHSEVGNFTLDTKVYEQNEIEFLPVEALSAADQLVLAKWAIRNCAFQRGLEVTFAPKITTGKAGSGLHIHMKLMQDGHTVTVNKDRTLSDYTKKMIGGLMTLAPAITAFGNTNPTSYLRLVPHQEAPTSVCWGDRNRSVLVRVPLGWTADVDMCKAVNGQSSSGKGSDTIEKQTFEIRSADASADVYLLLAALTVAARVGLTNPDSLKIANDTYVDIDIHRNEDSTKVKSLKTLPVSCAQSADILEKERSIFEADDVFSPRLIDGIIKRLKAAKSNGKIEKLVAEFYHCG